jgi:hypothetical protein
MTQLGFGLVDKEVKGRMYRYFWTYNGSGHKTESYLGPSGEVETQRGGLQRKLAYLESLLQEIQQMMMQTRSELEQLPRSEGKRKVR